LRGRGSNLAELRGPVALLDVVEEVVNAERLRRVFALTLALALAFAHAATLAAEWRDPDPQFAVLLGADALGPRLFITRRRGLPGGLDLAALLLSLVDHG
jgi:hypothetical protein